MAISLGINNEYNDRSYIIDLTNTRTYFCSKCGGRISLLLLITKEGENICICKSCNNS